MTPDPIREFLSWYEDARRADIAQAEGMALATCEAGRPSVRVVLFRGLSGPPGAEGLRFFTNYESRKGVALAANPAAAACFWWEPLGRQVRFEGQVERLPAAESDEYFAKRPRGHQLGAWASDQSRPQRHEEVVARYAELERRHAGGPVPRPPHWGGYRLVPDKVELWTSQESRLHLRELYTRAAPGAPWQRQELGP